MVPSRSPNVINASPLDGITESELPVKKDSCSTGIGVVGDDTKSLSESNWLSPDMSDTVPTLGEIMCALVTRTSGVRPIGALD